MAFSVTLKNLAGFAAASNLQLFLRKTSDNLLVNAGGDTGSDPNSVGSFTWTIAEDRPAEQMLARIYEGSTETAANIVIDSVLNVGFTEIGQEAAVLDSDSITAVQSGLATSAALTTVAGNVTSILEDTGTTIPAQITALSGSTVQVASPNVSGNLVLTQGDDYDGTAHPKATWTVTTDYTDGWSVTLTIRDVDDAVIYTTAGEVVSSTVVAVTISAPTGLTMTGCPGQWQGKFDVQLSKAGKKKTIALGVCYINEDQTR